MFRNRLRVLLGDDEGAQMTEYGLLVLFVALVALMAVTLFGLSLADLFDGFADWF